MKLKKKVKIVLLIIIIGLATYFYYTYFNKNNIKKDDNTIQVLKDNNIPQEKYSKTLEYVLLNNIYNEKYLDEYKDIEFQDMPNFGNIISTFLNKGYKGKEINYLFKISNSNLKYLEEKDYVDISKYYEYNNFNVQSIDRYNEYANKTDYSIDKVITYVNIKLDLPVYTNTIITDSPDSLTVLVNKYNGLPNNYKPNDLAYVAGAYGNNVPMRSIAKENFLKLQEAAKKEININLLPTTAYRDYSFQKNLYNNYVNKDGVEAADKYSARPGFSEHQTGLAIDLKNTALKDIRLTDDDFKWLSENAYKYGFIIRYPKDKVFITGYQFENWHIRYVGYDEAKIIYENNLTLEEYVDLYITEY